MARKRNKLQILSPISALCDAVVIYGAMLAAFWMRFHWRWIHRFLPVTKGYPGLSLYLWAAAAATIVLLLLLRNAGFYRRPRLVKAPVEFLSLARTTTLGFLVLMALAFSIRSTEFSRGVVGIAWVTTTLALGVERAVFNAVERWLYTRHHGGIRVLFVGGNAAAARIADGIRREPRMGYRVVGWIRTRDDESLDEWPCLGTIDDLEEVIERDRVHEVILAAPGLSHDRITDLMGQCERSLAAFKMVPDLFEVLAARLELTSINGIPVLGAREFPLDRLWNRTVKRTFDILGAAAGLVITAPFVLLAALCVRLDSKGPALYRQRRLGENGREFTLYKLRTMVVDAEPDGRPGWTVQDDPRCTRVGRILRRTNIDELPQLWNVLIGQMSLVGPRPERPHYVDEFKRGYERYMTRHAIRPGMTGWAQVNGLRGDTSIAERLKYDLYYLEHWSLSFDIKILFLTLFSLREPRQRGKPDRARQAG